MKTLRQIFLFALAVAGLYSISATTTGAAEIRIDKGILSITVPDMKTRDSILLQYRSRTRDALRVGFSELVLTNTTTRKSTRLDSRIVNLENRVDEAGYWVSNTVYTGMEPVDEPIRIEGVLTLYLVGSQQRRKFRVYVNDEVVRRPRNSSIDWGVERFPE